MRPLISALCALSLGFFSAPALARELSVGEVSSYLNDLETAHADFVQTNSDGTSSKGELYMERPGRIRFEYAAPDDSLVIAGQGVVALFDAKSNEPPQKLQLALTPLKLILNRDIDLANEKVIVGRAYRDGETILAAQDPEHPEYGSLQLYFAADPVRLTRWALVDGAGAVTQVDLGEMETGMRLPSRLFNVEDELAARGFD